MDKRHTISKITRQYFSRNVMPYWCILLLDTIIVFFSCLFVYWVSKRTGIMFDNRFAVFYTALLFSGLSWVGARVFKTYAGVVRYSSFVDLLKVAYANVITLILTLVCSIIFREIGIVALSAISPLETVSAIAIATLLMWAIRIIVKMIYI